MDVKHYLKELMPETTTKQLEELDVFYDALIEKNKVMNLTAITDYNEVYLKHFYDSLLLTKCLDINNKTLCDVGSGAGFPGLPVAIFTECQVTIIDALQKRINFLNEVITKLGLKNVKALHERAEEFVNKARSSFDIVTARAVARLNILAELCLPLVKVGGFFVAMKGSNAEELEEASKALKILGAELVKTYEFMLPEEMGLRHIYVFKKIRECPSKYPRSFAKIKNNPL